MADEARGRLSLAFRDIDTVPAVIAKRHAQDLLELDLSNNDFSTLSSLAPFTSLETLILDHNELTSHSKPPPLPRLRTLWVNHNRISNLSIFIDHLAAYAPGLRHLSMLNNEACPNYFNGGTAKQYADYRLFVISRLKELRVLDDQAVTSEERKESLIAYAAYKTSVVLESGTAVGPAVQRVMVRARKTTSPPPSVHSLSIDSRRPSTTGSTPATPLSASASTPPPAAVSPSAASLASRRSPRGSIAPPVGFEWKPGAQELDAAQIALAEQQRQAAHDSDWSSDEDVPEVYSGRASRAGSIRA